MSRLWLGDKVISSGLIKGVVIGYYSYNGEDLLTVEGANGNISVFNEGSLSLVGKGKPTSSF